jgi:RNA polymerase sigma factor (TIGR02999 family)
MSDGDVTRFLEAAERGDPESARELLTLVYDELRRLAGRRLAGEAPGHTLQATALVHEAYLRLVGTPKGERWENRRHFFGAAAEAMRRILVESARGRHSQKRGGGRSREDVDDLNVVAPEPSDDLLAIDPALDKLAAGDPRAAELVKLRYFVGLSLPEAAEVLGISPRTADRTWAYARAWLHREIGE